MGVFGYDKLDNMCARIERRINMIFNSEADRSLLGYKSRVWEADPEEDEQFWEDVDESYDELQARIKRGEFDYMKKEA